MGNGQFQLQGSSGIVLGTLYADINLTFDNLILNTTNGSLQFMNLNITFLPVIHILILKMLFF